MRKALTALLAAVPLLVFACSPTPLALEPGPGHVLRIDAIEPVHTSGDDASNTRTEFYLLYTDRGTFATSIQGSRLVKEGEKSRFYAESFCTYGSGWESWQTVTPELY